MTEEDIRRIALSTHELKLLDRHDSQTEVLTGQTEDLIAEIRRLRSLVQQATTHLKEHNPKAAEQIEAEIDWTPTTPGF
jgi:hypothetical protein